MSPRRALAAGRGLTEPMLAGAIRGFKSLRGAAKAWECLRGPVRALSSGSRKSSEELGWAPYAFQGLSGGTGPDKAYVLAGAIGQGLQIPARPAGI